MEDHPRWYGQDRAGPRCAVMVEVIVYPEPDLSAGGGKGEVGYAPMQHTTHSHPNNIPSPPTHSSCRPPHIISCCPLEPVRCIVVGWLVALLAAWLVCLFVVCLFVWLVGCLVGWWVGWFDIQTDKRNAERDLQTTERHWINTPSTITPLGLNYISTDTIIRIK